MDEILYMTYADTHTYTFKLLSSSPEYYIENIVLHYNIETANYDEYLIQYNITAQEYLDISNGEFLSEQSNALITDLATGTVSSILAKSNCSRVCETIYVNCTAGGNHAPGQLCGGNIDQQPYTFEACGITCVEEEDEYIDAGPSNGGGGGNSTVVSNPVPTEPCENDANGNTEVGIVGNNGECVTVNPRDPITQISTDPCDELEKLGTDEQINDSYADIQDKVDATREYGYSFAIDSNPLENQLANNNSVHMNVPYGDLIYGYSHTHPNITDPRERVFPMFSTADIYKLGLIAAHYSNPGTGPKDYNIFFATLTVNNNGNDINAPTETYAIKISDILQFSNYINNYGSMSERDKKRYDRKLIRKYDQESEQGGGNVSSNYLKVLFKFLEAEGISGIDFYKATDESLTQWDKLSYNSENNTVSKELCN